MGRWMTPDPAGLAAVDPGNPQSWNRYAYVLNNPMSYVDASGLSCENPHDGSKCVVQVTDTPLPGVTLPTPSGFPGSPGIKDDTQPAPNPEMGCKYNGGCAHGDGTFIRLPKIPKQPNIRYLQAKVFFAGLGRNFADEFREGGCFRQFVDEAFNPAQQIAGLDTAIKSAAQSGAYVAAVAYTLRQGLVVPMRSSIVREILEAGETGGEVLALGATVYEEGRSFVNEMVSYARGDCR